MGGPRRYFPCAICGKKIDMKTTKDEDILWDTEDDGIAHASCIPDDNDRWIDTDEMRAAMVLEPEDEKKFRALTHKGKGEQ